MIRRLLALIPRPLVNAVPVSVRDALRTGMLRAEKRLRRAQPRGAAAATLSGPTRDGPSPAAVGAAVEEALSTRLDGIESQLRGIARRLEDVLAGIDQLDARIGATKNGPAPSPVDDITAVIEPLHEIRTQLTALAATATVDDA